MRNILTFVGLAAICLVAPVVQADVIPYPLPPCPDGSESWACHGTTGCRPNECQTTSDCKSGQVCHTLRACVGTLTCYFRVMPGIDASFPSYANLEGRCPASEICNGGKPCRSISLCMAAASTATATATNTTTTTATRTATTTATTTTNTATNTVTTVSVTATNTATNTVTTVSVTATTTATNTATTATNTATTTATAPTATENTTSVTATVTATATSNTGTATTPTPSSNPRLTDPGCSCSLGRAHQSGLSFLVATCTLLAARRRKRG